MPKLLMNEIFRYGGEYKPEPDIIDGYKNHFSVTFCPDMKLILLAKGINPITEEKGPDTIRRPAILIRSSPHKIGSPETPWQDTFDIENGHIRYYGDNKTPGFDAALSPGNKVLIEAYQYHTSLDPATREKSTPIIFYKSVPANGKTKGFVQFKGFGIIRDAQLVTQYDNKYDRTFSNYVFDFLVFSLAKENEEFDWQWINDRRDNTLDLNETTLHAPESWKIWLNEGPKALEKCRRRVSKLMVFDKDHQITKKGTRENQTLKTIYQFYEKKKGHFESLALEVTAYYLRESGMKFHVGWVTPSTSDGGADFYGRLDVGTGFGKAKMIVLGQAKCEKLDSPTSGKHIARTVARLKRGWLGVYVTTSYYSSAVQREIIEDAYPILLINGKKLAEIVQNIVYKEGYESISEYLSRIEKHHDENIQSRQPNELLLE